MANPFLPEDPFALAPSDQDIETFASRGRKPTALQDWEDYAASRQQRAERRGFANPFAMIAHDNAEAGRDEKMHETEARLQAELEREIGVPATGPRPAATPAPQKTLLVPHAGGAGTRLPEDGEQRQAQPTSETESKTQRDRGNLVRSDTRVHSGDTISPAGAPDGLFGGEDNDAIANQGSDGSAKGDFGRRDYGEKAPREADALYRRVLAGHYQTFAQAEADIEASLSETPEMARAFKKAARTQFDGDGNWQSRLPGAGRGPDYSMARLLQRMARGQEIDDRAEHDRQIFAGVNRRGAMKVERAAQPGWTLWDAGGGDKLPLANIVGQRFALDQTNGVQTLKMLQALTDPRTDLHAWREEALALLPRRHPTAGGTWHGMADIDWAAPPPDPDAVRQLDAQMAQLGEGGDRLPAAYALLPLIGHRVLGPSVLEIGIEFIVGLSPMGDIEEVSEAGNDLLAAARAGSAGGVAPAA